MPEDAFDGLNWQQLIFARQPRPRDVEMERILAH